MDHSDGTASVLADRPSVPRAPPPWLIARLGQRGPSPATACSAYIHVLTNKKASPIHGRGFSGARPRGRAPSSGTGSRAGFPRSSSSQLSGSRRSCARVLCANRLRLSTLHRRASAGGAPVPRRPAARTSLAFFRRSAGSPRDRLDFAEPALEESALGLVADQRQRPGVALRGLFAIAEPAQQVGAR